MSKQDLEKLVHAFISSSVDYCNGLFTGLPKKTIKQLQLIQNAAARVLTRTKRSDHITPVLRSLHCLPVSYRIDFKALLLVFKSLNGMGPNYLFNMFQLYAPTRSLRSHQKNLLVEPAVRTRCGEAAFSCYAVKLWNQLPDDIKNAPTVGCFKSRLKIKTVFKCFLLMISTAFFLTYFGCFLCFYIFYLPQNDFTFMLLHLFYILCF
ncbi:hypothetical protein ACEWY4_017151 [Coilia grayii]|uniref:Uncharacterized protein n=1 Tax=Coilia grayii TaxID=363190 RepID=A0ABD1JFZ7_9TELE